MTEARRIACELIRKAIEAHGYNLSQFTWYEIYYLTTVYLRSNEGQELIARTKQGAEIIPFYRPKQAPYYEELRPYLGG